MCQIEIPTQDYCEKSSELEMIVVKILKEICKQNGIGNNNHKDNKDMVTLKLIHAQG